MLGSRQQRGDASLLPMTLLKRPEVILNKAVTCQVGERDPDES